MPYYLNIDMTQKDAYIVKERLTLFFETVNQKNAKISDDIARDLELEVKRFNVREVDAVTALKSIDNFLALVIGDKINAEKAGIL